MTFAHGVEDYGYLAVLVGCFIEGETVLLLAALAAQAGFLALPQVVIAAALGGFLSDQTAYLVGRHFGARLITASPHLVRLQPRIRAHLDRHANWVAFSVRFAIGLRTALPVTIGASGLAPARFALPNALGALAWSTLVGGVGYGAGSIVLPWIEQATSYAPLAIVVIALFLLVAYALWRFSRVWWTRRS
jgi:membrane protein DedA with SNARE-associated domain